MPDVRPLSAYDVVAIWERGAGMHPIDQALLILAAGYPELPADGLPDLPLGERDARLVALRIATLGASWEGYGECPRCAERVEFPVPAAEIVTGWMKGDPCPPVTLRMEEVELVLRLPTSRDLAAVVTCASAEVARRRLLQRCVVRATCAGTELSAEALTPEAERAVAERLGSVEANGEMLLNLTCPRCEHAWQLLFDPGTFFWGELVAQARRLFHDVDTLARAYGWREEDILAMSPQRRQAYLSVVAA
jgi:hypothetical protein